MKEIKMWEKMYVSIHRSYAGAKTDGVAQLFVFDLMKSDWEEKLPRSHAIELNVDIVMSSSPIPPCSEALLNLLKLEKSYLKHLSFDGLLNVMIRFAHPHGWDVRDDVTRERIHNGLRNLFREGVNLEVMSADNILEEMKVDRINQSDGGKVKQLLGKRYAWKSPAVQAQTLSNEKDLGKIATEMPAESDKMTPKTKKSPNKQPEEPTSFLSTSDAYQHDMHHRLWNILQNTKRIISKLDETLQEA